MGKSIYLARVSEPGKNIYPVGTQPRLVHFGDYGIAWRGIVLKPRPFTYPHDGIGWGAFRHKAFPWSAVLDIGDKRVVLPQLIAFPHPLTQGQIQRIADFIAYPRVVYMAADNDFAVILRQPPAEQLYRYHLHRLFIKSGNKQVWFIFVAAPFQHRIANILADRRRLYFVIPREHLHPSGVNFHKLNMPIPSGGNYIPDHKALQ